MLTEDVSAFVRPSVIRVYLHPLGGCSPLTFGDTPGYTLPAAPLARSPCNHWYNLHVTKRLFNAFRNSGVTFDF